MKTKSAIGLTLIITAFLAVSIASIAMKPNDIVAWLQGLVLVAFLVLMAINKRRRWHGRLLWSGVSPRTFAYWNFGLGVLFSAIGCILFWRESYINGLLNFVGGLGLFALGVISVIVLPNSTIERDAARAPRAPHRER